MLSFVLSGTAMRQPSQVADALDQPQLDWYRICSICVLNLRCNLPGLVFATALWE